MKAMTGTAIQDNTEFATLREEITQRTRKGPDPIQTCTMGGHAYEDLFSYNPRNQAQVVTYALLNNIAPEELSDLLKNRFQELHTPTQELLIYHNHGLLDSTGSIKELLATSECDNITRGILQQISEEEFIDKAVHVASIDHQITKLRPLIKVSFIHELWPDFSKELPEQGLPGEIIREVIGNQLATGNEHTDDEIEKLIDDYIESERAKIHSVLTTFDTHIGTAIEECLTNGIRHGNSSMPFKSLKVAYGHIGNGSFYIHARDQGQGFSLKDLPDPTDPENILNDSGRGVLMMKSFTSRLVYNGSGNEVILLFDLAEKLHKALFETEEDES